MILVHVRIECSTVKKCHSDFLKVDNTHPYVILIKIPDFLNCGNQSREIDRH